MYEDRVTGVACLAPGGAAPGIGAGLASMEIFKTTRFEGDTVTPLGAAIGGIGCALLFGFIAIRDGRNRH